MKTILLTVSSIALMLILWWLIYYIRGNQFALRNRLNKVDAIVVLAGTRGDIKFLDSKIQTAVQLYQEGWAPYIICSGKFSAKVADSGEPNLIPLDDLQDAVKKAEFKKKIFRRLLRHGM